MRKFRVLIHGRNFLFSRNPIFDKFKETGRVPMGFHTARYVEADSPEEAQEKAVDAIRRELAPEVKNDRANPPAMYIEHVAELSDDCEFDASGRGYSFFTEKASDAAIFEEKDI
jgi:hypothetical protein